MASKNYKDVSKGFLKALQNPTKLPTEWRHLTSELTFFGRESQADFARLLIIFYPGNTVIELKSLKTYLSQYRDIVISYERLLEQIYEDLISVYSPVRLRLEIWCRPRGGLATHGIVDSDWEGRGGKGEFWRTENFNLMSVGEERF